MQQNRPLINGTVYGWAMIKVFIAGDPEPLVNIRAIEYSDTVDMENVHAEGQMPVGRGYGNYNAAASITLLQEDVQKIMRAVQSRRLQDLPLLEFVVTFAHPNVLKQVTDRICGIDIPTNKRSLKQGDKMSEVELPLLPSHIEWDEAYIMGLIPKPMLN